LDTDTLVDFLSRQRAIRNFDTSRDVDDALIEQVLFAATRAPTGGNRQMWRWLVIRDPAIKDQLATVSEEETAKYMGAMAVPGAPPRPLTPGTTSWRDVPVLLMALSEQGGGGPSIFPAVQNALLAIQQLGLGSVLTTLWKGQEERVRSILKVPAGVEMHAVLPIGWPDRKYGKSKRRPVSEITYRDTYATPW
jgi:nitroreductase